MRMLYCLLVIVAAVRAQNLFAPVADGVVVSIPDVQGVSKVIAVGETVATNGPKVGDKVSVDNSACSGNPVPGFDGHCLVPQRVVYGTVQPISSLLSVTPVDNAGPGNVTVRGYLYTDFGGPAQQDGEIPTLVITIKGRNHQYTALAQIQEAPFFTFEATVAVDDVYVCSFVYAYPYYQDELEAYVVNARGDTNPESLSSGYIDLFPFLYPDGWSAIFLALTFRHREWSNTGPFKAGPSIQDQAFTVFTISVAKSDNSIVGVGTQFFPSLGFGYVDSAKREVWDNTDFSGTPVVTYDAGSSYINNVSPWSARFTGVFIVPFTAKYTFFVKADDSFSFSLFDVVVLTGANPASTFSYAVSLRRGDRVPFRLAVINSVGNGGASVDVSVNDDSPNGLDSSFTVPDDTFSFYSVVLSSVVEPGFSSWSEMLAQAFVQCGTEQQTVRVVNDTTPFPAQQSLDWMSWVSRAPVWHIADVNARTGIEVVNKIIFGSAIENTLWQVFGPGIDKTLPKLAAKAPKFTKKSFAKYLKHTSE